METAGQGSSEVGRMEGGSTAHKEGIHVHGGVHAARARALTRACTKVVHVPAAHVPAAHLHAPSQQSKRGFGFWVGAPEQHTSFLARGGDTKCDDGLRREIGGLTPGLGLG